MALSEVTARKATPREKPYKLTDGGGLYLHIQPRGSKLWRMKYRYVGKEKLLSFGPYPLVSIAAARHRRDEAKKLLLDGADPGAKKKQDHLDAELQSQQTFGLVATEFLDRQKGKGAAPS